MSKPDEKYSAQEIEARMQAALRGARSIGPKPKNSNVPKRGKKQRVKTKRRV